MQGVRRKAESIKRSGRICEGREFIDYSALLLQTLLLQKYYFRLNQFSIFMLSIFLK